MAGCYVKLIVSQKPGISRLLILVGYSQLKSLCIL
jgi:hypothetical protein